MTLQYDARTKQSRVTAWVREVFTKKEANDARERSLRTAEEALELAQACGVDTATLHRLVDYVMGRPAGEPAQEIAGTMVTLYAMAAALGVDADAAFETELVRIQQPEVIDRCRRRQHEKREALTLSSNEQLGLDDTFMKQLVATRPVTSLEDSLVDVTPEDTTLLPSAMVEELGRRIWFLRGKDHWEAWSERELEETLAPGIQAPSIREDERVDSVRYALRDAIEKHIDRCGGIVAFRSIPDEKVAETFLESLDRRGLAVAVHRRPPPLADYDESQTGKTGALR